MGRDDQFPSLAAQIWFAKRIGAGHLFAGRTDNAERRERIRQAICDRNLADVHCGTRDGKDETFAETFERLFEQPLNGS